MNLLTQRAIYGTTIILLLSGSWIGGRWMLADFASGRVERQYQEWTQAGAPSLEEWSNTQTELENAKRLNPNDANYYQLEGILHEWRLYTVGTSDSQIEQVAFLQLAADAYRISVSLRPAWPYAWAQLARQKSFLGQIDEEFDLALERATTLGAWEQQVHQIINEIGLLRWENLNTASRAAVIGNLQRGLSLNGTDALLLNSLQTSELFPATLCPLLEQSLLTSRTQRACD